MLLVLGGLAIAGPSGLLAWGENLRLLDQRQAQIAQLSHQRKSSRCRSTRSIPTAPIPISSAN